MNQIKKPFQKLNLVKISLWTISLILGFFQAWTRRFVMSADGISYLDLGDAYFRGDWNNAISIHYSPLYPLIVSAGLHLLRPSIYWEFPVVHLVNFFIYICTLASFHFFLMQTIHWNRNQPDPSSSFIVCSNSAWLILGYAIFLWFTLLFIEITAESPDMIAAALLLLAMGIILRISNGKVSFPVAWCHIWIWIPCKNTIVLYWFASISSSLFFNTKN